MLKSTPVNQPLLSFRRALPNHARPSSRHNVHSNPFKPTHFPNNFSYHSHLNKLTVFVTAAHLSDDFTTNKTFHVPLQPVSSKTTVRRRPLPAIIVICNICSSWNDRHSFKDVDKESWEQCEWVKQFVGLRKPRVDSPYHKPRDNRHRRRWTKWWI